MFRLSHFVVVWTFLFPSFTFAAPPADPPATTAAYDTVVKQYLAGQWDELEESLKSKDLNWLKTAQKQDVAYIRQSLLESRPIWWRSIKTNTKTPFHFNVFSRGLDATFDPAGKSSVQMNSTNGRIEMTVNWPAADMDNPAQAEHGFTKGELNNLNIFGNLDIAAGYSVIPISAFADLNDEKKSLFFRVLDFQGNMSGTYYGSPRARQWGFWLFMHSYESKYASLPTINARKALAVTFMMEVLANPKKYPSIKLPETIDSENTEEKLALEMRKNIEKHGWTLAEDRSLREAVKTLAAGNDGVLRTGGIVKLAGGQFIALTPEQDAALRAKRDARFKKTFDGIK